MNNSLYKKYLYTEEQINDIRKIFGYVKSINYLIECVKLTSNLYIPPKKHNEK